MRLVEGNNMSTENNERIVLDLIQARGEQPFAAHEIAAEAGLCRQTIYKLIRRLNAKGYQIGGEPSFGFVAARAGIEFHNIRKVSQ